MARGSLVVVAALIASSVGCVSPAAGQSTSSAVQVRVHRGDLVPQQLSFAAGAPIDITGIDNTVTQIRVFGAAANAQTTIGHITLSGPRFTQIPMDLVIGEGDGSVALLPYPNTGDWFGLSLGQTFKGFVRLGASIGGNVAGPITAAEIDHLTVGFDNRSGAGTIDDVITVRDGISGIRQLHAYRMSSKSRIEVLTGDIGELVLGCPKSACGEMLGDIRVRGGAIRFMEVSGPIGQASRPSTIECSDGVDFLICDRFVGTLNATEEGGKGWLKYFECRRGDFSGTIRAAGLGLSDPFDPSPRGLYVKGTYAGQLRIDGDVNYDVLVSAFDPSSQIVIGGSLLARLIARGEDASGHFGAIRVDTSIGPIDPEFNASIPIGIFATGSIESLEVTGPMVSPTTIATEVMVSAQYISSMICRDRSRFDLSGAEPNTGIKIGLLRVEGGPDSFAEGIWDIAAAGVIEIEGDCGAQITIRDNSPHTQVRVGRTLSGLFRTLGADGWAGQLTVNAANAGGAWIRAARVDRCATCTIPIGPGSYTQTSQSLGGGSIGVVPFALHESDCLPRPSPTELPFILDSGFQRADVPGPLDKATGVALAFYGPIKQAGSGALVRLFRVLPLGEEVELTQQCRSFLGDADTAGFTRVCTINGNPDFYFAEGDYRIQIDATSALACDGLLTSDTVPVAPANYWFKIGTDCDRNDVHDTVQIANEPYSDVNFDGFLDLCQRLSGQLCVADFNLDGAVDGSDRELFEIIYEQGFQAADVNLDGGVDGQDFETFYRAFEIGC